MSAFLIKDKVLAELDAAIERCELAGIPTPNLKLLRKHLVNGWWDWSGEGD